MAAEDDNLSDVSEADVNQMAKSIAVSLFLIRIYAFWCILWMVPFNPLPKDKILD